MSTEGDDMLSRPSFHDLPYERPDLKAIEELFRRTRIRLKTVRNHERLLDLLYDFEEMWFCILTQKHW